MNPILRNILAVIGGMLVGSVVNMGLIMVSGYIIPPPEGADVTTMEGLAATMHLFEPRHFIFPFLAHAFGTLAGAWLAAKNSRNVSYDICLGYWRAVPCRWYYQCNLTSFTHVVQCA